MNATVTAKSSTPAVIRQMMWDGFEWRAAEVDGELFLTRSCRGCWATGEGYGGMWSTRRHTVELTLTVAIIEARAARVARLRAMGEVEAADELEAKAGRFL